MADESRASFPASFFLGDNNAIIEAGDIPAAPSNVNGRVVMKFIDGSDESAAVSFSFGIPDSNIWTSGSGVKLKIYYFGDSAGTNSVIFDAALECITEGDAVDMHASGDAFAAHQSVTDAVDAGVGRLNVAEISFSQAQADAIEPGDSCRIVLRRDSLDGSDNYADSVWVAHVDLYEVVA